jgi:prepilin signal peptidase PulO-like enzyme (type II secretory pathway)
MEEQPEGQQALARRQGREDCRQKTYVTVIYKLTYKILPISFCVLLITAASGILFYTFGPYQAFPKNAVEGVACAFGGIVVLVLFGRLLLRLEKECQEKKNWDRRISQASQVERGLQSPSCAYRCAGRWESAWEWVKECIYQEQIFPCVLCSICGRAKKKRSSVAESYPERDSTSKGHIYRSGGREAEGSSSGSTDKDLDGLLARDKIGRGGDGSAIEGTGNVWNGAAPQSFPTIPQRTAQRSIKRGGPQVV